MARRIKGGVTGDAELNKALRAIGGSIKGSDIDAMSKRALEPMKQKTRENARARRQRQTPASKHLDQGVVVAKVRSPSPLQREFWLSFRGRAQRIAHLVEFGTAPHAQPNRGIIHPGARPYPFARPAFESTKEESGEIFAREVWNRIEQAVSKEVK